MKNAKIEVMKESIKIQGYDGNWNYEPYMHGMYNGMELMLAIAEGRVPVYKDAPKEWLADKSVAEHPIAANAAIESTEILNEV